LQRSRIEAFREPIRLASNLTTFPEEYARAVR
jgi:hypothetical protein